MAAAMVKHMADLSSAAIKGSARDTPKYNPSIPVILPKFMEASTCSAMRSEEHTSELQSLMRISYAVFCLKKKKNNKTRNIYNVKTYNNHEYHYNPKHTT